METQISEVSLKVRMQINGNGVLILNPPFVDERHAVTIGALAKNFLDVGNNKFKFTEQLYTLEVNANFKNGKLDSKLVRFVNNL